MEWEKSGSSRGGSMGTEEGQTKKKDTLCEIPKKLSSTTELGCFSNPLKKVLGRSSLQHLWFSHAPM